MSHLIPTSFIFDRKRELLKFSIGPQDFSRTRKLDCVRTVGFVLHLAANGNPAGYSISSQNFFSELGLQDEPPCQQSVSEARSKLHFGAFQYLLSEAYRPDLETLWHGHRVMIADGTKLTMPRTGEVLEHVSRPNTKAGVTHYPQALMVTAISSSTGQPVAMEIGDHKASERDLLLNVLARQSQPKDLWLLDRGLGGAQVYFEFYRLGLDFIHRVKTSGDTIPEYLRNFLKSRRQSEVVAVPVKDENGEWTAILVRLVRGPKDSEGKRIVFATSLLNEDFYPTQSIRDLYRKRWGIETMYNRVKNILNIEKFHARSWNGILQEIYANLVVISLAAQIDIEASRRLELNREQTVPNFKAVIHVVKRHLACIIGGTIVTMTIDDCEQIAEQMVQEAMRVVWRKRPGRSYPRVSRQPIKSHNLCKQKKLQEFYGRKNP